MDVGVNHSNCGNIRWVLLYFSFNSLIQAGVIILGYITLEEVESLRSMLLGTGWMVSLEEPLDARVRDAVRHLSALLLAAKRNSAGLIHQVHE